MPPRRATEPARDVTSHQRYVITKFGAVGDGQTVNTKAIQSAIDACADHGGGVIVVPKGVFLSDALFFKQGVNLLVETNAVLKATARMADFPPIYTRWEGVERYWTSAFLNFIGLRNVTVSGAGTIDGSGLDWPIFRGRRHRHGSRPPASRKTLANPLPTPEAVYSHPLPTTAKLNFAPNPTNLPPINAAGIRLPGAVSRLAPPRAVVFQNCKHVRVSGLHLKNQARWGFVFIYCRNVVANNLNIHVDGYIPSSDGVDVCSSRNVRIRHCNIACTDDDISIKAGKDADGLRVNRPSENITISNCTIGRGGGIDVGSEVSGSIRHVMVRHCTFNGTSQAARMKSQPSRGGVIQDITWRDIKLNNVSRAFDFEMAWRMVPPLAPPAKVLTVARHIRLVNFSGTARSGGVMIGLKGSPLLDVKFRNCNITADHGLVLQNVKNPDLSGLHLKVAEGKPIIYRTEAAQTETQQ